MVRFSAYEANSNELIRDIVIIEAVDVIWQAQLVLERFGDWAVEHNLIGVVEVDVANVKSF